MKVLYVLLVSLVMICMSCQTTRPIDFSERIPCSKTFKKVSKSKIVNRFERSAVYFEALHARGYNDARMLLLFGDDPNNNAGDHVLVYTGNGYIVDTISGGVIPAKYFDTDGMTIHLNWEEFQKMKKKYQEIMNK